MSPPSYALGARIVQLDYKIRGYDPLLKSSQDALKALASGTGCATLLSSCLGDQIINVHSEGGGDARLIALSRGQSLPLFRGAASTIILANFTPNRLQRLYSKESGHPDAQRIASNWKGFARHFRRCRAQGYAVSQSEIADGVTGIAAPVFNSDGQVIASISLIFASLRKTMFNEETLARMVRDCAAEVTERLRALPMLNAGTETSRSTRASSPDPACGEGLSWTAN